MRLTATVATVAAMLALAGSAQAATFTVNSVADGGDAAAGDGTCATTAPAVCTLRAAMEESEALAAADTITFALPSPSTINLTGKLPGIVGELEIDGPGPSDLTVRRPGRLPARPRRLTSLRCMTTC